MVGLFRHFATEREKQQISLTAEPSEGPNFTAKVHLTEPLGDVVILDLEANGAAFKLILPEEKAVQYGVGDEVSLSIGLANTHVFATETGTVIR